MPIMLKIDLELQFSYYAWKRLIMTNHNLDDSSWEDPEDTEDD